MTANARSGATGSTAGLLFDGRRLAGRVRLSWRQGVISAIQPLDDPVPCRTIVPGFVDAHLHLTAYAQALLDLDLTGLGAEAVLARLAAHDRAVGPGEWMRGRQVSATSWATVADRRLLDQVTAHPLALWSQDLHLIALNTAALAELGVANWAEVPGGEIGRDQEGAPSGVLKEKAAELAGRLIPGPSERAMAQALETTVRTLHRAGVVGAASYETPAGLQILCRHPRKAPFALRLFQYATDIAAEDLPGEVAPGLSVIGAKIFLDGTLGSRTAWLKTPFADRGGTGICRLEPGTAAQVASLRQRGYVLSFHAIGDAAFAAALTLLGDGGGRIEHIQLVDPADLARVDGRLVASVQPSHLIGDRPEAARAWAGRLADTYPYRSLWQRGATLVFGSDAPVVAVDPLATLRMAVDRRLGDEERFVPEQALPLEVALAAATSGPTQTLSMGSGHLSVGEPATFALIEGDLRHESGRREATVRATVVAGETVHGALG